MPELPEVETIVRGLNKVTLGRQIKSVEVRVKKLFFGDPKSLVDKSFKRVSRIGKNIVIELSNGKILQIHLKMTGQLIFLPKNQQLKSKILNLKSTTQSVVGGHPDKVYNQPLPHKYTHIIISFSDGSTLYYNDLRKFGWMKLVQIPNYNPPVGGQISNKFQFLNFKLGIDALDKNLTSSYLDKICQHRKTTIKQLILDQTKIAGIGNIYADESLFTAGILPTKQANQLTLLERRRLAKAIPNVLSRSIELGGTSKSDYRKIDGTKGNYLDFALVYGREGLPCRKCQIPIKRIKIGQRSSHYCPKCQK